MLLIGLRPIVAFYGRPDLLPPLHKAGTDRNVQILRWLFINKWQYDVSVSNRRRRHCVRLSLLPASGARLRSIIRATRGAGAEANAEGSRAAVVRVVRCNVFFFLYFSFIDFWTSCRVHVWPAAVRARRFQCCDVSFQCYRSCVQGRPWHGIGVSELS